MKINLINFYKATQSSLCGLGTSLCKKMISLSSTVFFMLGFIVVAVVVNPPLRAELTKSLTGHDLAQQDTNNSESSLPKMELVSFIGKTFFSNDELELLTPEILRTPVPSIAPLANNIKGKIDPQVLDSKLLVSLSDQRKVAQYITDKYKVDFNTISQYVSHTMVVAREVNIDPILILSIMAVESRFNAKAQSYAGAQGLMQVITRLQTANYAMYGGNAAAFRPEANIRMGAYIFKMLVAQAGSLEGGLRYYVGGAISGDQGYTQKVLRERDALVTLLGGIVSKPYNDMATTPMVPHVITPANNAADTANSLELASSKDES